MLKKQSNLFRLAVLFMSFALLILTSACQKPEENMDVILSTTTSTQDSGLLDDLLPIFEEQTGYRVKTIAVGTGAALEMGKKGEADVLLVHAPAAEIEVVESGAAINRQLVMHNDFIIVGPESDPAKIKGETETAKALAKLEEGGHLFVSRGDDSGTHKKELEIWGTADITPDAKEDDWYQETGSGMAATLLVASEKNGYTMTDRATYLAQKENLALEIMVEGDTCLLNIYHVMQVNPEGNDKINAKGAKAFVDFLISDEIQSVIEEFGIEEYGQPLFFPDAGKPEF